MQTQTFVESEYRHIEEGTPLPDAMGEMSLYDLLMSIKPAELTPNAWMKRAEVNRSWLGDVRRGVTPKSDTLAKMVEAAGLTMAQFYELQEGITSNVANNLIKPLRSSPTKLPQDLPLLGTVQGSDMSVGGALVERMEIAEGPIDLLERPDTLLGRNDVYALTIVGHSVSPKYEDGDPVYVDPKRQPSAGDYVVVQMKGDGKVVALLKELVRRTSDYVELRQLQPEVTFRIPLSDIRAVHRVIPWREIVFH